jgi:hypothetical protein
MCVHVCATHVCAGWSGLPPTERNDVSTHLRALAALAALAALLVGTQAVLWGRLALRASHSLHGQALHRVLQSPLSGSNPGGTTLRDA